MKPTQTQMALLFLVLALCTAIGVFRLREFYLEGKRSAIRSKSKTSFCAGVEHPQIGLSFVCADKPENIIAEAISKLGLPSNCGETTLPLNLRVGDKMVLSEKNNDCAFSGLEPLPAGLRLISGRGLNVNLDSADELALMPGIGEVKARRIVEEREENGPFKDLEDLTRVHGIGAATVERLEPWIEWK